MIYLLLMLPCVTGFIIGAMVAVVEIVLTR
jgi:hypothetical protein